MAIKWTCDYPECGAASEGHEEWMRTERMPSQRIWLLIATPLIGTLVSLIFAFGNDLGIYYCPEHAKFLKGGR